MQAKVNAADLAKAAQVAASAVVDPDKAAPVEANAVVDPAKAAVVQVAASVADLGKVVLVEASAADPVKAVLVNVVDLAKVLVQTKVRGNGHATKSVLATLNSTRSSPLVPSCQRIFRSTMWTENWYP